MALRYIPGRGMVFVPDPPPKPAPPAADAWAGSRPSGTAWRPGTGITYQPPPAPAAPKVAAPAGVPAPAAPAAAPFGDDAQAAAARAQALFDRSQRVSALQQQGVYDASDLAEAVRRLHEQQPKDEQTSKEGANRQGLFYSGTLGKRLGEIATNYARRESDQRQAYQRREAARLAAIGALDQGAPIDDASITAALIDRLTAEDLEAASTSSLVANPAAAAPPPPATPKKKAAPKPKLVVKRGKVFRLYPGRKPIYIRPSTRSS